LLLPKETAILLKTNNFIIILKFANHLLIIFLAASIQEKMKGVDAKISISYIKIKYIGGLYLWK